MSFTGVQRLGSVIGCILWYFPNRSKLVTLKNIALCFPHLSKQEKNALAKQSLFHTGKTIAESALVWVADPQKNLQLIKNISGMCHLETAVKNGKPIIILAPHIGNWELFNLYVSDQYDITVMYKPTGSVLIDNFIKDSRMRCGTELAPTSRLGVAKILQALKNKQLVGILPDQEPDQKSGIFAPFFTIRTLTTTLIPRLVKKTGAEVIIGYAKRLDNHQGFDIVMKPVKLEQDEGDLLKSVTIMNQAIEDCVNDITDQYQWEYKRFKRRPPGEKRLY